MLCISLFFSSFLSFFLPSKVSWPFLWAVLLLLLLLLLLIYGEESFRDFISTMPFLLFFPSNDWGFLFYSSVRLINLTRKLNLGHEIFSHMLLGFRFFFRFFDIYSKSIFFQYNSTDTDRRDGVYEASPPLLPISSYTFIGPATVH